MATPTPRPHLYRWRFGSIEFDEARFELRVSGLPVDVEQRPLQVLALLLQHTGEVVTKEELFDTVWAGRITVDHVLATAVGKLRKVLDAGGETRIFTVPRVGYRFDGPVERIAVGERLAGELKFEAGQPVPGRPHFVLGRPLGRTLGSEVWLAHQPRSREARVFKFSLAGEHLAAIKREATLMRVLRDTLGERDDFVRVIDWNFETQPFFLECEYGGQALPEWAAEDDRLAAMDRDARIAFFIEIAEAAAAALSVGVLHKDLKPANILVAARGNGWRPRLTDFGSSRLLQPERLEELGITRLGMTVDDASGSSGTPLYLAPELVAGQPPTVRSDVYALGVILYQWLVGDLRRPMAPGWEREIDDPLLREDIALSTDSDPARRIADAGELAVRLRRLPQRHAERERREADERAAAAMRQALERTRVRRPWIVATIAVLGLGLVASSLLWYRSEQQREAATLQAARAAAVSGFLQDLMVNADPGRMGQGREITVREALGQASSAIEQRFAETPATEATVRLTAGDIYASLGEFGNAVEHLRRAVSLLSATTGASSEQTLHARYRLAIALSNASAHEDALQMLEEADRDAGRLDSMPPIIALAADQAWGRYHLTRVEAEAAAIRYESALRRQTELDPDAAVNLYTLRMDLAQSYVRMNRGEESVALMRELQDPRYARAGVPASRRATGLLFFGSTLLHTGHTDEATGVLTEALAAVNATFGPESMQAAQAESALAGLYGATGDFAQALRYVRSSGARMCALHGDGHPQCLQQRGNEGVTHLQLGDAESAVPALSQAHAGFLRLLGAESPGTHVMAYYLACALLDSGRADEAGPLAAALDPDKLAAGSPGLYWDKRIQALRGAVLLDLRSADEGLALLRPAVEQMQAAGMEPWFIAPFVRRLESSSL